MRPLYGKRVLITRAQEQSSELVHRLTNLGADPIEAPTIKITPPENYEPLDKACAAISTFDWIIFTSVNGVDYFMQRLLGGPNDVRNLKGVRLCAIGPATAERLNRFGLKIDLMPSEHRAEAIIKILGADQIQGKRVLLPRADIAREVLATELRHAGAEVIEVTAYCTVLANTDHDETPDVYKMLLEQEIDVVTFTSASTVRNFVKILGSEATADLLQTTLVAAIGPVTAAAAKDLGIITNIMPTTYTIPALVDAITEHFNN